ncbi:uncharacterized protein [Nicotiana sylvestris]|uniref:uncharacterized protein n=1 Tax=Nicotiana sylvestris TaxID=4096 RepID=UPI00388C632D
MIKKENLPIPPTKNANGEIITSTDPLDLDDYTDEQAAIITVNVKAKNLFCETAKEIWDKLEVTYEGTNKVEETRINLLVREYELFQKKDGESVEECFLDSTKSLESSNLLEGLLKVANRGDLIAFEKTHLYRQIQEKKKTVSFNATMAEPKNEDEVEGGEQDENIAMLSQVMTNLMRRNKNYSRGSIVGKYKRRKLFGAWSNEEEFDHEEIANMCFMDLSDNEEPDKLALMTYNNEEEDDSRRPYSPLDEGTSEVHTHLCPSCYKLQEFVDIALADIERVVNELRKVKIKREREREKKDCALKLEICEVESDIHQKEVNELRLQLNGTELELRIILEMSTTHLAPTVAKEVTPQIIAGSKTTGGGFGDQNLQIKLKNLTSQDPSRLGYLKISNHVLQEHHKKNRKGKWYLDSACSRHMKGDKQLFKSITKLDGETITFGDKSKGNVISTGKVPLSSTCDVDEVYLVDELGYNLLSTSVKTQTDRPRWEKDHQTKSANQQNQPVEAPSEDHDLSPPNQSTNISSGNTPNEWRNEPGYPRKFIIGDPQEGITTRRSQKNTSHIALISQIEPKKIDEALNILIGSTL